MTNNPTKQILRAGWVTLIVNALLSAVKLLAGLLAGSGAMISDAAHTMSDVLSTIVVMIGARMAGRAEDQNHNYGHEKFESIAGMLLSLMLFAVAIGIGIKGVEDMLLAGKGQLESPGWMAAIAAALSIGVKEWMYHYAMRIAKKTGSTALKADAWHHRTDALSSIGALIGIIGARLGFPVLDAVAALVIAVFIVIAAWKIFQESASQMTDKAADADTIEAIQGIILSTPDVLRLDDLKTRVHANRLFVEAEISVDGHITLEQAHDIAHLVHDRVESSMQDVKHCFVHVNPMHHIS